jgi:uncharacterized delta-60 repeat protein
MRIVSSLYCLLIFSTIAIAQQTTCFTSTNKCWNLNRGSALTPDFHAFFINPDNSLLTCGQYTIREDLWKVAVAKYNNQGVLDSTFGLNGIATPLSKFKSEAFAIQATQTKIFVVGCMYIASKDYHADYAIWCFTKNGLPDTSFNGVGWNIFKTKTDASLVALKIQSDDKVICAGTFGDKADLAVAIRFNKNGSIDNTFGRNGIVQGDPEQHLLEIADIASDSRGRIMITGSKKTSAEPASYVWRILPDGKTDDAFGKAGYAEVSLSKYGDEPRAIEFLSTNEIAVAGFSYLKDDSQAGFIFHLDDKGQLSKNFCGGGAYQDNMPMREDVQHGHYFQIKKDGVTFIFDYKVESAGDNFCKTTFSPQ